MPNSAATQNNVLEAFRECGALLEGHFILRSGHHSRQFFQCARVGEQPDRVSHLATLLLQKLGAVDCDTVVAIAMGGLVIGQEIARQARKRYVFLEKGEGGKLALRRHFTLTPGEKVLIVEDVITRGGRVKEAIDIITHRKGRPVGISVLVDRRETPGNFFGTPLCSLVRLHIPTYPPDDLPDTLKRLPAVKPGS